MESNNKKHVKNYVNNKELYKMVVDYNNTNYTDDGTWVVPYMKKMRNKYKNGNCTLEELNDKEDFIKRFTIKNLALRRDYLYGSMLKRRKMKNEFFEARTKIMEPIYNITEGIIRKNKLYGTVEYTKLYDIKLNAVLKTLNYLNRYDETKNSSALAYITQQSWNFVVYFLKQMNDHSKKYVSSLDFFDNINTIDDFRGEGRTSLYESL